ncbi:PTS system sucrose-specific IIB component (Glc family) /PTS system sucrose-specific IIC component (Glc family) [Trichococcus patagoniensis]|uniref:protein-N(pi)-phosphohistidine--sucrose phosphotransferase n=1 Tax=Trichococcus patagoniensis TaxID=382641 RepID=A0A2T5IJZ5_9LACT|nr:sucrose-specific PTS transporter subunit IIBC [Trichococcus patagoniensis]PTQ84136.1 PTS system sucrose-specific IIB component (Glc family) /PTS system sucrose-specific IIC component (Glc family) [Trichococcus patagoniensis]
MDYKKIAEELLTDIGGKDNVQAATHCATRLRLVLRDESKVDQAGLDERDEVKGTFSTAGQYQIILGSGIVNEVYKEFIKMAGIDAMSKEEVKTAGTQKLNPIQQGVKMLSDIFVPIIPAIVACGLMMGLNNVFTAQDLFVAGKSLIEAYPSIEGLAAMINTFSNAAYVFLPILIGFSATQKFGGNPYLGAVLGMLMVHPDLVNAYAYPSVLAAGEVPFWDIFGFEVAKVGYQGTVLPILFASYILAKVETFLHKRVHTSLDNLITPLFALFATGFLTFTLVGPLTRTLGDMMTNGLVWLYDTTGAIGGAIIGFFYAPLVITGMHHSFIAVETQLLADIAKTGGTFLFPIAAMSNVSQGAAALAMFFIIKEQKAKSLASASAISAYLGITEPAMFGINLKYRYPFYAAIIGSSISSAYITFFKVKAVAMGAAGLPGIIAITQGKLFHYIIGMLISSVVTIALTYVFSKKEWSKAVKK